MKKIYLISALFISLFCNAQSPIIPLDSTDDFVFVDGAYYKDINNYLNNYVGEWEYVSGSTSIKIILQKRTLQYDDFNNIYEDILIGEYRYVENGVEKINTLPLLSTNSGSAYSFNIFGNSINRANNFPVCTECDPNEKRVILLFSDPQREHITGLFGRIALRLINEGGQEKIEMWLMETGNIIINTNNGNSEPEFDSFNIPWGKYILTKIN